MLKAVYGVEKQQLEGSKLSIRVTVPANLVDSARKSVCRWVSKSITVPGFRPGKVPVSIMKRHVGVERFDEFVMGELLTESYYAALEQEKINPVTEVVYGDKKLDANEFSFEASFAVAPEFTLGDYNALEVEEVQKDEVTEAEMNELMERLALNVAEKKEPAEDEPIENGDQISVLAKGKIDGESSSLLRHYNRLLIVGKNELYPGLDENFIGKKKMERVQLEYSFPEDYAVKGLAGKKAELDIKVLAHHKIQIPEINDEFAKNYFRCDTLVELQEQMKAELTARKENEARKKEMEAIQSALYKVVKCEIPETLVQELTDAKKEDLMIGLEERNITLSDHLIAKGQTEEEFNAQMMEESRRELALSFALTEIAEKENLDVSDEEVLYRVHHTAYVYKKSYRDILEYVDSKGRRPLIKSEIKQEKAMNFLQKKYTKLHKPGDEECGCETCASEKEAVVETETQTKEEQV
jgi:trigger factor